MNGRPFKNGAPVFRSGSVRPVSLPRAADEAHPAHRRLGKGKRGAAKSAFGKHAPDIPMCTPATGAMIDLILAIDGMVAARRRIMCEAFALSVDDGPRHGSI